MVRGYRTISREAASLLAGLPPWDLEATVLARMHDLRVEMQRSGETPLPRQVAVWRTEFRQDLGVAWRLRLSQLSAGHAIIWSASIKEERTPECRHCVDTVEHRVEVCPTAQNTAGSPWRLSVVATSRAGPWFRPWSGAKRGGGR
ncbi:hypothetical protein PYW07_017302 [Mythimna separata]|uniref:Reverse transcriptase n=1 Tax=Mythimna separata TaxID=271217 RepID=A0AAD8DYF2_MYTSE|nr:hypothetical protein PYW07_017302 [Mythimna separata]